MSDSSSCARQLGDLLAQLPVGNATESWINIETTAQNLANGLRVRDDDNHTTLGRTLLPQTLTSLLKSSLEGSPIPSPARTSAVFEILRIGANLCMDHDENRGHLLEAGFPQEIVLLLEGYAGTIPKNVTSSKEPLPLTIPHLKIVKTAIAVLLNASISYEPVRSRLTSLEAALTLLRLSGAIYPPGLWLTSSKLPETSEEDIMESWILRSGLSNWAWRTIEELKDDSHPIFNPDALPFLTPTLQAFIPPYATPPPTSPFAEPSSTRSALIRADWDVLEESCTVLESLSLDVEDVRLSLARGVPFPAEHNGVLCLSNILDFIEKGDYPPLWSSSDIDAGLEKKFDICKAALIKAIVEVAGEDKNEDVLWDETEADHPGGQFVCRMVNWIKTYAGRGTADRDDLVICATLSLGNLARRETNSTALLSPPLSLAPLLSSDSLLSPATDIKVKHGVIGLLKHLAQSSANSPTNRAFLSESGVVPRLVANGIWDQRGDAMAEVVQMGAIGVVKHLCNGNVQNACDLVLASKDSTSPAGLEQIIALVRRSDTIAVKSEGTRVLVNVIKSLWSSDALPDTTLQKRRQEAIQAVLVPASAEALASLVGRSMKYPLLVNEGVVAMTLLSTQKDGGPLVLDAILSPLPIEVAPNFGPASASATTGSDVDSPIVASPTGRARIPTPRRALDRLATILKNTSTPDRPNSVVFPIEVRANVCALLGQAGRSASGEQKERLNQAVKCSLEDLAKTAGHGREGMLGTAAKKSLDGWAIAQTN
ncbi:hypothetical protein PILCRDRAFT_815433 [Piloderma croceum F 1598]|uniref:Uncharacterized protein n=1 Tax=Piloderma croceum (strain F 1598) TaxID=765440 RepID=A0A0C3FS89_PILCF|nr:hypothetical protein PILCRDRAFT_815433 [Piloderma croceum F 1598]